VGISVLNNGLKLIVDRDRPAVAQLTGHAGSSFPSGHSAAAAACWSAIAFILARRARRSVRASMSVGAVVITVGVATSRVLLGVHWVTDVVAGVLVGWTWFTVVTVVFGGRLLEFGEPADRIADGSTLGNGRHTEYEHTSGGRS
jgi:undecaprenyl-diphosphatase